MDQERLYQGATGELTNLLYDIALAAKVISGYVRRAGLLDVLGAAGAQNVQGEQQQKLDVLANDVLKEMLGRRGQVAVMASEEDDGPIIPPIGAKSGAYAVLFDPLDGSSNIDVNVSIGTIFSVHRRKSGEEVGVLDCLQRGRDQVAGGYIIYGSSTVLVYTAGDGVHCFTLDPTIGEFCLINGKVVTPSLGKYYSVNESNYHRWTKGVQRAVRTFKGTEGNVSSKSTRYIGSLVADFHRNLIYGGVFLYPADTKHPNGKLRLLYEANPLGFVAEQAGGAASNGKISILDVEPTELHQRTPLFIGAKEDVQFVERVLKEDDGAE